MIYVFFQFSLQILCWGETKEGEIKRKEIIVEGEKGLEKDG
jgi:hypothetical protein